MKLDGSMFSCCSEAAHQQEQQPRMMMGMHQWPLKWPSSMLPLHTLYSFADVDAVRRLRQWCPSRALFPLPPPLLPPAIITHLQGNWHSFSLHFFSFSLLNSSHRAGSFLCWVSEEQSPSSSSSSSSPLSPALEPDHCALNWTELNCIHTHTHTFSAHRVLLLTFAFSSFFSAFLISDHFLLYHRSFLHQHLSCVTINCLTNSLVWWWRWCSFVAAEMVMKFS